jgi:hypothetical protein
MNTQRTFAGLAWSQKGKVTRRERFLAEMDAVIPWAVLVALLAPHYPKAGKGRQPLGLEKMLRIYFYRGLAKNTARAFALFALANLYMVRYRLLPAGAPCRP